MPLCPAGRRKSYTPAFRREAAHLVIDTGRPIAHVAKEIGIGEQLLGRWVARERAAQVAPPAALDADERAELVRLSSSLVSKVGGGHECDGRQDGGPGSGHAAHGRCGGMDRRAVGLRGSHARPLHGRGRRPRDREPSPSSWCYRLRPPSANRGGRDRSVEASPPRRRHRSADRRDRSGAMSRRTRRPSCWPAAQRRVSVACRSGPRRRPRRGVGRARTRTTPGTTSPRRRQLTVVAPARRAGGGVIACQFRRWRPGFACVRILPLSRVAYGGVRDWRGLGVPSLGGFGLPP
jgi:Transposase